MELEQLIPEKATITKTIEGEGESRTLELVLREFNLEDESWLKAAYGDKLQELFEQMDMDVISRVAFHQLEVESKKELMKLKFFDVDENGEDIEIAKTGPQKFRQITKGYVEQFDLLKALLKVRGFSMPIVEEIGEHLMKEQEENKGKRKARKKK